MQNTVTCYNMIYGHSQKDRNVCPGWVMFPPYAGFQRFGILFGECYICYQQRSFSCFISRTSIPSSYPLVNVYIAHWKITMLLIGKSTISMGYFQRQTVSHYQRLYRYILHFPRVFLWFSHGFPMVSYGFLWFPMVFPWFSHGFPMVFPWFSHGFSHGFPMVFPWFSHGFSHGFPMVFPWVFPWVFLAISFSAAPRPWSTSSTAPTAGVWRKAARSWRSCWRRSARSLAPSARYMVLMGQNMMENHRGFFWTTWQNMKICG